MFKFIKYYITILTAIAESDEITKEQKEGLFSQIYEAFKNKGHGNEFLLELTTVINFLLDMKQE